MDAITLLIPYHTGVRFTTKMERNIKISVYTCVNFHTVFVLTLTSSHLKTFTTIGKKLITYIIYHPGIDDIILQSDSVILQLSTK